jgi:hypothetical protein
VAPHLKARAAAHHEHHHLLLLLRGRLELFHARVPIVRVRSAWRRTEQVANM